MGVEPWAELARAACRTLPHRCEKGRLRARRAGAETLAELAAPRPRGELRAAPLAAELRRPARGLSELGRKLHGRAASSEP